MSTMTKKSSGGGMIQIIALMALLAFGYMVMNTPDMPSEPVNIEMSKGGKQNHRETQFDWINSEEEYRAAKKELSNTGQTQRLRKLRRHGKAKGWENKQKRASN